MSKFNFNIDIDNTANTLVKSKNISLKQKDALLQTYFVDLGLPSKTIWAKYNLGVNINNLENAKQWYGNYYAWGEINSKNDYSSDTYKFYKQVPSKINNSFFSVDSVLKYVNKEKPILMSDLHILELEDDAAYNDDTYKNIGFQICIPTFRQLYELKENTSMIIIKSYNNVNGLNGAILKSKYNDNQIFFPFSGHMINMINANANCHIDEGHYWSSNLGDNDNSKTAYCLKIQPKYETFMAYDSIGIYQEQRHAGLSIRPIFMK